MSLRSAKLWHLPQLLHVLWANTRLSPVQARSKFTDAALMLRCVRRGWVWLAKEGDGFLVRDSARVHALYVHPKAQGRGTGQRLMQDTQARTDQLELWVQQDNQRAIRFYEALGFTEVARTDGHGNDEKQPDICMRWQASTGTL
ncbi:putative acetyltransferase [Roseovarius albus]|uniref:Putative acetyltransferase n=1 Tax=Roseovarius albus TaxID=1247867 RepID=A0A1X7A3A0_9RHOB|nr:GNAT family N-acetyltransferase [Roseovarius albus]SLN69246.1 putative acetyltransferase [Roseovarius albus]